MNRKWQRIGASSESLVRHSIWRIHARAHALKKKFERERVGVGEGREERKYAQIEWCLFYANCVKWALAIANTIIIANWEQCPRGIYLANSCKKNTYKNEGTNTLHYVGSWTCVASLPLISFKLVFDFIYLNLHSICAKTKIIGRWQWHWQGYYNKWWWCAVCCALCVVCGGWSEHRAMNFFPHFRPIDRFDSHMDAFKCVARSKYRPKRKQKRKKKQSGKTKITKFRIGGMRIRNIMYAQCSFHFVIGHVCASACMCVDVDERCDGQMANHKINWVNDIRSYGVLCGAVWFSGRSSTIGLCVVSFGDRPHLCVCNACAKAINILHFCDSLTYSLCCSLQLAALS